MYFVPVHIGSSDTRRDLFLAAVGDRAEVTNADPSRYGLSIPSTEALHAIAASLTDTGDMQLRLFAERLRSETDHVPYNRAGARRRRSDA